MGVMAAFFSSNAAVGDLCSLLPTTFYPRDAVTEMPFLPHHPLPGREGGDFRA